MKKMKSAGYDKLLIILILFGIFTGIFFKIFAFDILNINGISMEPSIRDGQKIIINKMAYGLLKPQSQNYLFTWKKPQKGDVVSFLHDNKIVIKRCVLTSGDYLEILSDSEYSQNYIIIDGKKISLQQKQINFFFSNQTIPEGYIFVLGDNSENSIDSRDYGFVAVKNITGKVIGK